MFWRYCHDIMVSEDEMLKNKQKKTRTSIPTSTSAACFGFDKKANKIERRAGHKISCGKNRPTLHEFFFGEKVQISRAHGMVVLTG